MENNLALSSDKVPQNRAATKRIPRFLEEFYNMLEVPTDLSMRPTQSLERKL